MIRLDQLSQVELALTDFRAVINYEAAFFAAELRARAAHKAGEMVVGAFAQSATEWRVPPGLMSCSKIQRLPWIFKT